MKRLAFVALSFVGGRVAFAQHTEAIERMAPLSGSVYSNEEVQWTPSNDKGRGRSLYCDDDTMQTATGLLYAVHEWPFVGNEKYSKLGRAATRKAMRNDRIKFIEENFRPPQKIVKYNHGRPRYFEVEWPSPPGFKRPFQRVRYTLYSKDLQGPGHGGADKEHNAHVVKVEPINPETNLPFDQLGDRGYEFCRYNAYKCFRKEGCSGVGASKPRATTVATLQQKAQQMLNGILKKGGMSTHPPATPPTSYPPPPMFVPPPLKK